MQNGILIAGIYFLTPCLHRIYLPPSHLMKAVNNSNLPAKNGRSSGLGQIVLVALSLLALIGTFLLTFSNFTFEIKVGSFAGIVVIYLALCFSFYLRQNGNAAGPSRGVEAEGDAPFDSDVENRLFALEEANRFFGTSLKPADMFRLVASRVNELLPFSAFVILFKNAKNGGLKAVYVEGENAEILTAPGTDLSRGIAGRSAISRKPQLDENLIVEKDSTPAAALEGFDSAIVAPLFQGLDVFGVLQLYSAGGEKFTNDSLTILEAISERVAPLFLSSMAFEQTLTNALTDSLTNLPNERAFYMLLENQVAESQRYRDVRPLTILAIDIKNFAELNQEFGHVVGDRILSFASDIIKGQLRKMDFLSRTGGDEFLAVLPTAPEKIGFEIIERLERVLVTTPFEISGNQYTNLQFNFGWATFWKDGETAPALLQNALLRKQQAKSTEPKKVLWFPREYVN